MSAQRYLSDVDAAAASARRFVTVLQAAGPQITMGELRRLADSLDPPLMEAERYASRLTNERLEDARLEDQRQLTAPLFQAAVAQMEEIRLAAGRGDPEAVVAGARRLGAALDQLRAVVQGAETTTTTAPTSTTPTTTVPTTPPATPTAPPAPPPPPASAPTSTAP